MKPEPFAELIGALTAATGAKLSPKDVEVWRRLLADIPDDALRAGMLRAANECPAFPSVALVRRLAAEAQYGLTPGHGEAFERVMEAVRKFGACIGCQPVCEQCRETAAKEYVGELTWRAVRALGGWRSICESETSQRRTLLAQFRQIYDGIAERETELRRLPPSLRPRINGETVETPKPAPKALPAPEAPTAAQVEKAKLLRVFRDPVEAVQVSPDEFERRREEQLKAAESLLKPSE